MASCLTLLLFISAIVSLSKALPSTCRPEFQTDVNHTMCFEDNPGLYKSGVSEADKVFIVDWHNARRKEVNPPAKYMFKLTWDDELAEVAQKWANQCFYEHDKNRRIPSFGMFIGQSMHANQPDWESAMNGWWREREVYTYGVRPADINTVGHYTQMVTAETSRVGCGVAYCKGTELHSFWICNYAPGQMSIRWPYTKGETCSMCSGKCSDKLCDCGGQLCKNGAGIYRDSCKCWCSSPWGGDDCSTLDCPPSDDPECGTKITKDQCPMYSSVCPYMCGQCPGK